MILKPEIWPVYGAGEWWENKKAVEGATAWGLFTEIIKEFFHAIKEAGAFRAVFFF